MIATIAKKKLCFQQSQRSQRSYVNQSLLDFDYAAIHHAGCLFNFTFTLCGHNLIGHVQNMLRKHPKDVCLEFREKGPNIFQVQDYAHTGGYLFRAFTPKGYSDSYNRLHVLTIHVKTVTKQTGKYSDSFEKFFTLRNIVDFTVFGYNQLTLYFTFRISGVNV